MANLRNITLGLISAIILYICMIYWRIDSQPLDKQNVKSNNPQILLKNFRLRQYLNSQEFQYIKGGEARFQTPNLLKISDEVEAWQKKNNETKEIKCQQALAYFNNNALLKLLENGQLIEVRMHDKVSFKLKDYELSTSAAKYKHQLLSSDMPTKIQGNQRHFSGNAGFNYDLNKEVLNVHGKVKGSTGEFIKND